jgi:hypothetical protein
MARAMLVGVYALMQTEWHPRDSREDNDWVITLFAACHARVSRLQAIDRWASDLEGMLLFAIVFGPWKATRVDVDASRARSN